MVPDSWVGGQLVYSYGGETRLHKHSEGQREQGRDESPDPTDFRFPHLAHSFLDDTIKRGGY
jgi:hypothetical protein